MNRIVGFLVVAVTLLFANQASAAVGNQVSIIKPDGQVVLSFTPFAEAAASIGSVASGDLGTDGVAEIVVGAGIGTKPLVGTFRQDGSKIAEFLAYAEGFRGGVNVAVCDTDGDGSAEIVSGAGYGGGPHIRIFEADGTFSGQQFFAYDPAFRGGVNVACADLTGDGVAEIVTGAGLTGGPHIKIFTADGVLLEEAFNGSASEAVGVYVTASDVDSNGTAEILASPVGLAVPQVTTFSYKNGKLSFREAVSFAATPERGSRPLVHNLDADPTAEIALGSVDGKALRVADRVGTRLADVAVANELGQTSLVAVSVDAQQIALAATGSPLANVPFGQYIRVDLSEQRLYAYENGVLMNSFLVSTGKPGWETPLGVTSVTAKIPVKDYGWTYGPNNPGNYLLPNVKYNLRFRSIYYIHSAYWHNNFGRVMSHGCVNTGLADAEWIYNWANVGATVEVAR